MKKDCFKLRNGWNPTKELKEWLDFRDDDDSKTFMRWVVAATTRGFFNIKRGSFVNPVRNLVNNRPAIKDN